LTAPGADPAPGHGAAPVVALQGVAKTYADGTEALRPVDLAVAPGEIVTLLGPSGCGKSTLLRIVAGLLPASAGTVALWGRPAGRGPAPGAGGGARAGSDPPRLGFVFQEPTLMPWASVQANVRLPLDLAGVPRAQADAQAAQALQRVGLAGFAAALPRQLSGGMRMRASLARSLVTGPALLLMDEPFGALDEITRNRLDGELLALAAAQRLTLLFVTHSIHEAVFLSHRVLVMAARPGRVVDEVAIDLPRPRDPALRVSPGFARLALRLQDALLRASAEDDAGSGSAGSSGSDGSSGSAHLARA
jgi:NitT/TauT family transport system ATP-binding protein